MRRYFGMIFAILILFASDLSAEMYVFGDSHANIFEEVPGSVVRRLGPVTMHRIGRDGFNIKDLSLYPSCPAPVKLKDGDAILFSAGAIDNYMHIYRQRDLFHRDVKEVIRTLVLRYVSAIYFGLLGYPNVTKIVYNIIPPVQNDFPGQWGTLEEKIASAKMINQLLKSVCPLFGIEFLDTYADYADERGVLRYDLSDGDSHIGWGKSAGIRARLNEILLTRALNR